MLQIDYDIIDAKITDPGISVLDTPSSFIPVIQAAGTSSPYMVTPNGSALMLRPIQLLPGWASQTKFQAGDYNAPLGWESQQTRASNDYWMHATTSVVPLALAYTFPANTGWFVEFRGYAPPKTLPQPMLDFSFGQYYQLIIWNDGKAQLYDIRQGDASPIGQGNIANGRHFVNEDVSVLILPYRRGQLLIWSPTLGGYFEVTVQLGDTGNITEVCAPTVYSSVSPASAFVTISPLLYPADGVAALNSSPSQLQHALTQTPTFAQSVYDAPGASSLNMVAVTPYVATPPVTQFIYSVTMQGNTSHQTGEAQGVQGIGAATSTSSGDSVFGGGAYPYSLTTPFLYLVSYGYDRTLGTKAYTTNVLTGILSASLDLSRDRASKTFVFTVDNPANITGIGANYTSLKDLLNRRCRAYLTTPSLEAGANDAVIAVDPDPDTPLIVKYGYNRVYLFDGLGDQPEFIDGVASKVTIRCQGLRKRLRAYVFDGQVHYDGMKHTDVMSDVLKRCGFVHSSDGLSGMGVEIFCATDDTTLLAAVPGDIPLFTPAVGTTAEQFIQTLQDYTGWILDDLIPPGSSNSCWFWVPEGYFADTYYSAQGSVPIYQNATFTRGLAIDGTPIQDNAIPNPTLSQIVMLDAEGGPPTQDGTDKIINFVMVIGIDDNDQIIIAQAIDQGSISDRTQANYIGEIRRYILVSQSINTQAAANLVCGLLFQNLSQYLPQVDFEIPDYYPQLGIQAPLTLQNYWQGQIVAVSTDLSRLGTRPTKISVEKLPT